jgi:hypothetical protein
MRPTEYYCRGLAATGLTLNAADCTMLKNLGVKVLLLLDPDVWPTAAVNGLRQLRAHGVPCQATCLSADPKDVDQDELGHCIRGFLRR